MRVRELIMALSRCDDDACVVAIESGFDPVDPGKGSEIDTVYEMRETSSTEEPMVFLRY